MIHITLNLLDQVYDESVFVKLESYVDLSEIEMQTSFQGILFWMESSRF